MENPAERGGFLRATPKLTTRTSLILCLVSILAFYVYVSITVHNVRLRAMHAAYLEQSKTLGESTSISPPAETWLSSPFVGTLAGVLHLASIAFAIAAVIAAVVSLKDCARRFPDFIFALFALVGSIFILCSVSLVFI